jgi:hypothetical protein
LLIRLPSGPCHADSSAISTPAASIACTVVSTLGTSPTPRAVQRSSVSSQGRFAIRSVVICAQTSIAFIAAS